MFTRTLYDGFPRVHEGYRPFDIEMIRLDATLDFTLYIDNAGQLAKYVQNGKTLQAATKQRLLDNNVRYFYVSDTETSRFDDYLDSHLGALLDAPGMDKARKSRILYSACVHVMEELFESGISGTRIAAAKELMAETVNRIFNSEITAVSMLQLSSHDYRTYSHSVNVALYAVGIAHEYGLDSETVYEIASGAMLHDVGKCHVALCILNKPGSLSLEEFEQIREHPQMGYEVLLENGESNPRILDIVLNHHEKIDGSGYGRGLRAEAISFATQVVTIADIFDALTSNRPYKRACNFYGALEKMKREMRPQLDMRIVDSLIRMMGRA